MSERKDHHEYLENNADTLYPEHTDDGFLERPPRAGETAFVIREGGRWRKGPNLSGSPIAEEILIRLWRKAEVFYPEAGKSQSKACKNLSDFSPLMNRVHAIHLPSGLILDAFNNPDGP